MAMLSLNFNAQGLDREQLIHAGLKGINLVYGVLVFFSLPPSVYRHLFATYTVEGWIFLFGPLLYLPVAFGWFPRRPEYRVIAASMFGLVACLSINAVQGWWAQPGLYLTIPFTLAVFAAYGTGGLISYGTLVIVTVAANALLVGNSVIDVVISLSLWVSVATACCMMLRFVIEAAFERNEEVLAANEALLQREQELTRANKAILRVYSVISHELRGPASNILTLATEAKSDLSSLELVRGEAGRFLHVFEDLGFFMESDREFEPKLAPATVDGLLDELSRSVNDAVAICGYELHVDNRIGSDLTYVFDVGRVRAALAALVRSLVLSGEGGAISIRAAVLSEQEDTADVEFAVFA